MANQFFRHSLSHSVTHNLAGKNILDPGQVKPTLIRWPPTPILALVTVLPEYAGGKAPESNYVHYAAVNMTGANRLLFGVAWPLMAILHWLRTRQRGIAMATVNVVEICFQPRGCRQGSGLGLSIVHRVVERAPWKLRPQIRRALSAVNRAARPAATARGREGNNVRAMRPTTSATRRARGQAGWR